MANVDNRDNFKVVIKSRPLIKRERDKSQTSQWKIEGNTIECVNPLLPNQRYTFDHIYDENSTTQELFDQVAKPIVEKSVKGFNGTIFAYGQTSSGKTYTMVGDKKNVGIIRLAARHIFDEIMQHSERSFIVKVNYLEIYNEKVYDLLDDRREIKIQEFANGELKFGCTGKNVTTEDEILKWVDNGNNHRKVAETNMNVQSSRSHAILQIGIESVLDCDGASQVSVLNLVDLAGSERADSTGATGERLKEAGNINKSLLTLSIVINKLGEDPEVRTHIGYRDSKLTRILATSLGGNAMTIMICNITSAALEETNLTLGFATRAKKIENKPVINETVSDAVEVKRAKKLIIQLEAQLGEKLKEIAEYQKKEQELNMLKKIIIGGTKKPKNVVALQRRRTCPPNTMPPPTLSQSPLPRIVENAAESRAVCNMRFGDMGREVECTDADWGTLLNETLGMPYVDIDEDESDSALYKFPSRPELKKSVESDDRSVKTPQQPHHSARRSLLKTPKSLKEIMGKTNETESHSSVASPIALDKEKRIRMLEDELEQARHFHQTESIELRTDIKEKSIEITALSAQLNETRQKISDIESRLVVAEREAKEAKTEMESAVKAKNLAEQVKASIEYEYEEHQNRAKRREKELVEQLEQVGNDDSMKVLKQKLATMTEKVKSLETQLWQDDQNHKDELENMNAKLTEKLTEAQETIDRAEIQANKFKTLQSEYDVTSSQLVDMIEENDHLKGKCDDLNKEIEELKVKSELASTLAVNNADSEAKLKTLIQAHANEIQKLEENYQIELQSHEQIKSSLTTEIEHLKQTIDNHSTELRTLADSHREEVNGLTEKQTVAVKEFEVDIEEQKREILDVKIEHDDLLAYCRNLEHSNNMLENAWNQARMTVDCIMKEMDVLRTGYNDLKLKTYEQEIEHLKLQKTISEFDDTINFSVFNDDTETISMGNSTSICNTPQVNISKRRSGRFSNSRMSVMNDSKKQDESINNDFTIQLKSANEERDKYAARIKLILKRISSTVEPDISSSIEEHPFDDKLLDKFIASFNELKDLKVKCNLLEDAKDKNEQLICSLKNELTRTEKDLDRVSNEIADLKIVIANSENTNSTAQVVFDQMKRDLDDKLTTKEAELKNATDEIVQLKSVVHQYEQMKNETLEKLHKNECKITGLQEAIANHENSSKQNQDEQCTIEWGLNNQLALMVKGFDRALNEISELKAVIASSENLNSNNQVEFEKGQRELADMLALKDVELKNAMNDIVQLKTVADQYERLKNETLEKLHKNESKITELQEVIASHERAKIQNEEEMNQILRKIDDQATLKEKMTSEISEIQHELTDKDAQLMSSMEEIAQLKAVADQYERLKNETLDKLQKNERKITELQEVIANHELSEKQHQVELNKIESELKNQLALQEKDLDGATKEISDLKASIANSEHSVRNIKEEFDKIQRELNDKLVQKDAELKASLEEITQLKTVADQYELLKTETLEKLNKTERKIAELQEVIAEHEQAKKQTQDEFNKIQSTLNDQVALKEKESMQASKEIVELKEIIANYERLKQQNQTRINDLQHQINVLEEEQECLEKLNKKLQNQVSDHTEEMNGVQSKLAAMKQSKEKLEFEKQKLVEEMNAVKGKRHATLAGTHSDAWQTQSPRRRDNRDVDVESLLKENRTLKSMQAVLENEVAEFRKSTSTVRKIKRQSIHDDTRRISGFDSTMIDYGTQTDAVDEKCACGDMAKQITKLKQELVIIEAKYATFRLSTGVDELQAEVKTLKAELSATKGKLSRINIDYENLCDKHEKLKVKNAIALYKPSLSDAAIQTDVSKTNPTFIDQIDFERVNRRAEKYKKGYEEAVTTYNSLKVKYENMKIELDQKSSKCIETAKLLEEIQPKYTNMKRICNHRWDEIEEFKKQIASFEKNELDMKSQLETMKENLASFKETTEDLARYKRKYEMAKSICDNRRVEIERLNKLVNASNNENVPINK